MNQRILSGFWDIATKCNNFLLPGSSHSKCLPFLVDNLHVGFIRPDFLTSLLHYSDVFTLGPDTRANQSSIASLEVVSLASHLVNPQQRSEALGQVMMDFRIKRDFVGLRGWRNEDYGVYTENRHTLLFRLERSACSLLGLIKYGVHINGFVQEESGAKMWVACRSATKQTHPGMKDNMVAGGLNVELGIRECAEKECREEASVPVGLLPRLKPVGTVSFLFEDERGIFPEIEYIFDLELPPGFEPVNADGEVSGFELFNVSQVVNLIAGETVKANSALVMIDWLFRHGHICPDEVAAYPFLYELLHVKMPLHS